MDMCITGQWFRLTNEMHVHFYTSPWNKTMKHYTDIKLIWLATFGDSQRTVDHPLRISLRYWLTGLEMSCCGCIAEKQSLKRLFFPVNPILKQNYITFGNSSQSKKENFPAIQGIYMTNLHHHFWYPIAKNGPRDCDWRPVEICVTWSSQAKHETGRTRKFSNGRKIIFTTIDDRILKMNEFWCKITYTERMR